ncbi:MAG TPA: hypothetical protein VFS67_18700 [Polyangiaceae bacterium]|nr:hypothetical protein [Polyangiaceae bacterium]
MKQQFWVVSMLSAALAAASGCQKEKPPEPAPAPPPAPAPAPVAQAQHAAPPEPPKPAPKPLEWDDPPQWKRVPASGMRAASYEIPAAKGDKEAGSLNVFVLGGDVDANIQRWVDEFSGMDLKTVVRSDRKVNEMRQAVVEIPKGKFSGGMSDKGPTDNYGLLGAIVVAPSGAEYFFKLTGPAATVKAARAPFYSLLDSMREQGGTAEEKKAGDKAAKTGATKAEAKTASAPKTAAGKPAAKP